MKSLRIAIAILLPTFAAFSQDVLMYRIVENGTVLGEVKTNVHVTGVSLAQNGGDRRIVSVVQFGGAQKLFLIQEALPYASFYVRGGHLRVLSRASTVTNGTSVSIKTETLSGVEVPLKIKTSAQLYFAARRFSGSSYTIDGNANHAQTTSATIRSVYAQTETVRLNDTGLSIDEAVQQYAQKLEAMG